MIRKAAVADRFYTSNPIILREEIKNYLVNAEPRHAFAVIAPHAGYPFSGRTAAATYSQVIIPDRVIILGPNHSGVGAPFAIMSAGQWEMPFGSIEIDADLADSIMQRCDLLEEDATAHEWEHSLEVHVPFLQFLNPKVRIVPIALGATSLPKLKLLGRAIADAIQAVNEQTLIVASTDMSHTPNSSSRKQKQIQENDMAALEQVKLLDEDAFMKTVDELGITMCGYAPVAAAITAAKKLGAQKGTLVRYSTSYDISGTWDYVVGYAGVLLE